MKKSFYIALIAALAISELAPPSFGADEAPSGPQAEIAAAFQAAQSAFQQGPLEVPLGQQAKFAVPEGYVFLPPEQSDSILRAMGNNLGAGLLGMVFSADEGKSWFVVLSYVGSGYVKDEDAKNWKSDEMLQALKDGTEAQNSERAQRGLPEIEVLDWVEPPTYDESTRRLFWSALVQEKGAGDSDGSVNYNTYALGREGYISLNLVTSASTVENDKPAAHELLAAIQFNEGKRYEDFNAATDRLAEYGLAALVGGFAAKKLGLFALAGAFLLKFWKVIAVGGIAGSGLLARLFKKKPPVTDDKPES